MNHGLAEWDRGRKWLVSALREDTEGDVMASITAGQAQVWCGDRSAFVTQLVAGPEPYVLVWLGGGDMRELVGMAPALESWARTQGMKAARINGRKGWARVLRARGFAWSDGELRKSL